ncbi:hypothetical protein JAAARDRAFT_41247 [Jaapia argillacea MUCL 33604]|uniref:F-box domain-containing protein n=1 Tax=Jaapia argillacea MUCL 33604 TaxID=933084 RepID=A0A067PK64_9AGAM|nr:hypothetical protein JAAARDRAFT_41247 [Jaapia argillacea MUCL 33604]
MAQYKSSLSDAGRQSNLTLANIDSDIAAHLESIRQLCTKRNSLVPVSRLPPEVLANIFVQHASQTGLSSPPISSGCSVDWIAVTHVCRHWREVALATPRLWCSLPFQRPKWVPEMIVRSRLAPLHVTVNRRTMTSQYPRPLPQIHSALEHMSRIRSLVLELPASDLRTLSLSPPAPALNTLTLFNWGTRNTFPIPEDAFGLVTPSLRRLDLTGCTPSWGSPMFNGLTSLRVKNNSVAESGRPTFTRLLEILSGNPQLESLALIDCLSSPSSDSHPRNPAVRLPMLTFLHLEDEALGCSHLLSSLSVPPTTSLKLSSFAFKSSHFASLFASAKNLGISTPVLCLDISGSWTQVTLRGYDHPLSSPHSMPGDIAATQSAVSLRSDQTPHIEICLGLPDPTSGLVEMILTEGCSVMDLTCLEEIIAREVLSTSIGVVKESWWRGQFEKWQGVRTLTIVGRGCFQPLSALGKGVETAKTGPGGSTTTTADSSSRPNPAPDRGTGGPILLPGLGTLSIEYADLEERFYDGSSRNPAPFLNHLVKMLRWRKKSGKRVETLVLEACQHIDQGDVDGIRKTVGSVDWDGQDCAEDESDEDDHAYSDEGFYGYGY